MLAGRHGPNVTLHVVDAKHELVSAEPPEFYAEGEHEVEDAATPPGLETTLQFRQDLSPVLIHAAQVEDMATKVADVGFDPDLKHALKRDGPCPAPHVRDPCPKQTHGPIRVSRRELCK